MPRAKRYSISVTGKTYERLREVVPASTNVCKLVDGLMASALADPAILASLLDRCFRWQEP